jgi:hypothetical protein
MKDIDPDISDEKIQKRFPDMTLEEIAAIDCSEILEGIFFRALERVYYQFELN